MDGKPKVTVTSRAHRTLRRLTRYSPWGAKEAHASIINQLELREGEDLIGVYHNHGDSIRDSFVVTSLGIHINRGSTWEIVFYDNIEDVPMPPSKNEVTHLRIIQQGGVVTILPVTGRKERTFDAFPVLRFLDRVVDDRGSRSREIRTDDE